MDWIMFIASTIAMLCVGALGFGIGYLRGSDAAWQHIDELTADAWIERGDEVIEAIKNQPKS